MVSLAEREEQSAYQEERRWRYFNLSIDFELLDNERPEQTAGKSLLRQRKSPVKQENSCGAGK
jgi:hypothetical protein